MASAARVCIATIGSAALFAAPPTSAGAGQKSTIYVDVLSSWRDATSVVRTDCGEKVQRELMGLLAKRNLPVVGRGHADAAVPLESRVAEVWTSQKSSTTTYVGLLVERGKGGCPRICYPAAKAPPARTAVLSTEDLRGVTRDLEAADKAKASARLARLMVARLGSMPGSCKGETVSVAGDFLLDRLPGPAVVLKLTIPGDSVDCAGLPSGSVSAIADAMVEFLQAPNDGAP